MFFWSISTIGEVTKMIYHSHKWDKIVGKLSWYRVGSWWRIVVFSDLRRAEMVLSSADVPPIHGEHVVKTIIIQSGAP